MKAGSVHFSAHLSRLSQQVDALLARLPDFSKAPPSRQATVGLALSLAIHLLLFVALVVGALLFPERLETIPLTRDDRPLEIELVPLPAREDQLLAAVPKRTPILDAKGLRASDQAPEKAEFESDRDMVAGSELPATGLMPLPSQEGRDDLPGQAFATQDVILGLVKPDEPPSPTAVPAPQPTPGLRPLYDPLPVPKEALEKAQNAPATLPIPQPSTTPAPVPRTTPPPLKTTPADEDSLSVARLSPLATPGPITKLEPIKPAQPTPAPRQLAMLSTPAPLPGPSFKERFRESLEKTRIEGNISKRGRPGADAVKGPLGKYHRDMSLQVHSLWSHFTAGAPERLTVGTVKVRFIVQRDGRVTGAEVLDDGGDRHHADACLRAVQTAKLNPLPPDIAPSLKDGTLEIVYSFTLF